MSIFIFVTLAAYLALMILEPLKASSVAFSLGSNSTVPTEGLIEINGIMFSGSLQYRKHDYVYNTRTNKTVHQPGKHGYNMIVSFRDGSYSQNVNKMFFEFWFGYVTLDPSPTLHYDYVQFEY